MAICELKRAEQGAAGANPVAIVCFMILLFVARFVTLSLPDSHIAKGNNFMNQQLLKSIQISVLDLIFGLGTNIVASALLA